jgi:hypothetical protein
MPTDAANPNQTSSPASPDVAIGTPPPDVPGGAAAKVAAKPTPIDAAHAAQERARKGSARQRELEEQRSTLAQKAVLADAEIARLKGIVSSAEPGARELAQLREQAKSDPRAVAKALGIDVGKLAEALVTEGTPEAQIASLQARIDKMEAAEAQARKEATERQQRAEFEARERQAEKDFVAKAKDLGDSWLNALPEPRLIRLANLAAEELIAENRKAGRPDGAGLSFDKLVDYLRTEYGPKAPEKPATPRAAEEATEKASKKPTPPSTLTNRTGTTRVVQPTDFDKLPDREQRRIMGEQLQAALKPSA